MLLSRKMFFLTDSPILLHWIILDQSLIILILISGIPKMIAIFLLININLMFNALIMIGICEKFAFNICKMIVYHYTKFFNLMGILFVMIIEWILLQLQLLLLYL